jgi:hypothetical protein
MELTNSGLLCYLQEFYVFGNTNKIKNSIDKNILKRLSILYMDFDLDDYCCVENIENDYSTKTY